LCLTCIAIASALETVAELPRRHVGDVDLFRQAGNVASDEDDVSDDEVNDTLWSLRCHERYVDIAARRRRHADLASHDDCLTLVDGV